MLAVTLMVGVAAGAAGGTDVLAAIGRYVYGYGYGNGCNTSSYGYGYQQNNGYGYHGYQSGGTYGYEQHGYGYQSGGTYGYEQHGYGYQSGGTYGYEQHGYGQQDPCEAESYGYGYGYGYGHENGYGYQPVVCAPGMIRPSVSVISVSREGALIAWDPITVSGATVTYDIVLLDDAGQVVQQADLNEQFMYGFTGGVPGQRYLVSVKATADCGDGTSNKFATTDFFTASNAAPTISVDYKAVVTSGEQATIVVNTQDVDGDVVSFSVQQTAGVTTSFSIADDRITYVAPAVDTAQQISFLITASDGYVATTRTVMVSVVPGTQQAPQTETQPPAAPTSTTDTTSSPGLDVTTAPTTVLSDTSTEATPSAGTPATTPSTPVATPVPAGRRVATNTVEAVVTTEEPAAETTLDEQVMITPAVADAQQEDEIGDATVATAFGIRDLLTAWWTWVALGGVVALGAFSMYRYRTQLGENADTTDTQVPPATPTV
jgi:hypothetical protein